MKLNYFELTINNKTWSYKFGNAWTYTARCYVNWNITSQSCKKTVTVTVAPYCWDGKKNGWEQCDYKDPNKVWFWDWWCNTSCKPIVLPSKCDNLSANPNSWVAPLTSSFSCNWTKASNYKIEIKNNSWNVIKTINNKTWSYKFNNGWTYTARCYVNWNITSQSCKKTVTVWDWDTLPWFETVSCNSLTATPSSWKAPLDSSVVCSWTNVSKFKIDCWNWNQYTKLWTWTWAESFSQVCKYGSAWTYTPKCYVDDTITNAGCQKTVTVENPSVSTCDQIFEDNFLRYEQSYNFYDTYNNVVNQDVYLTKYFIDYVNPEYLDKWWNFDWTPEILFSWYKVPANKSMKFIKTWLPNWKVKKHPLIRTTAKENDFDFMIKYIVDYDFSNNYPDASDDLSHSECQYFSVTWCWDGVLDSAYETCDFNDPTKAWWWNDWCDNSCQPKNISPQSTCDNLTVSPNSWNRPLNVTATCSWTNASKYKITCGNWAILNSSTWQCTYPSSWTYEVSCTVNDSITSSSCKKTVTVNPVTPVPSVNIDKRDANFLDIDWNIWNDTQKVNSGQKAVFKIRVTNYSDEDLKDFVLTDAVEQNCAWAVTMPSTIPSTFSNFVIWWVWNHTDSYLEKWEYFEYTCEKLNTTSNYTNVARVDAKWKNSNIPVNDSDDTKVILVETNTPWTCDSMTITPSAWDAPLNSNVVCSWTNVSAFRIDCGNWQLFTSPWNNSWVETFSKVCNYGSANVYTPRCYVDNVTNNNCKKTVTVNSVTPVPSISIDKRDANLADIDWNIWNDTQKVNSGQKAVFRIKVTNSWVEDLNQIVLLDAIAPACAWTVNLPSVYPSSWGSFLISWNWDHSNSYLEPGEYFSYVCEKPNTTFDYTNIATVNAKWRNSNISVTSTDNTEVLVNNVVTSSCNNLSASPLNWTNSLNSTVVCEWTKVSKFKIDCWNGQVFSQAWSNSWVETFTKVCNYSWIWSYTPKCIINDTITNLSCEEVVSVSSSGGWWTWPKCKKIEVGTKTSTSTWLTTPVTCVWNSKAKSFKLDCWNWDILFGSPDSNYKYTWVCNYKSLSKDLFKPECYVSGVSNNTDPSYSWWKTSFSCKTKVTLWWNSYCWDWVVQRPNSNWEYEECERSLDSSWNIWSFPSFCSSSCKIQWGWWWGGGWGWGWWNPTTEPWVITIPNEWEIVFEPWEKIIIWDWMNPFKAIFQKPYVLNNSSYDLYFDKLCVVKKSWNTLNWNNKYCKTLTSILYPWMSVEFSSYPNYVWDITNLSSNESYWDNLLVITIQDDWVLYDDAFFAAKFNIRVSKPSIVTTWWGTSYIGDTSNVSNVSNVAQWYVDDVYVNQNRNFVWAWVSSWSISSYSSDVTDTTSVNQISNDLNGFDYNSWAVVWSPTSDKTSDYNEFTSYNWIDNVYIVRDKSFEVNSDLFSSLAWSRTYIVENWDLIINTDISYSWNIAFIVKWWNILIDKDVENMSWTYVTIKSWTFWWKILWKWWDTSKVLHVDGSLYWNTNDLISKRKYIRDNSSWQINVWTIVSFGSSLFRKPAPLVWEFVEEYLKQARIAQ